MSRNRDRRPASEIISGFSMMAIFGAIWLALGHNNFWIFPLVFVGVLPVIRGLGRLATERSERRRLEPQQRQLTDADREKEILRAAQQEGGRLTPATAALRTSCSVEEAEAILTKLASRGHVSVEVLPTGRIEYQFPEFMK